MQLKDIYEEEGSRSPKDSTEILDRSNNEPLTDEFYNDQQEVNKPSESSTLDMPMSALHRDLYEQGKTQSAEPSVPTLGKLSHDSDAEEDIRTPTAFKDQFSKP